jgi:6-phosphogluconolactonase (cycloisomerase 2 family)
LSRLSRVLSIAVLCVLSVLFLSCGTSSGRPAGLLYVVSQAESNVTSFAIDLLSGALSEINANATTCLPANSNPAPPACSLTVGMSLDPTGATAFVLNQGVPTTSPPTPPTIYAYSVNSDGSLSTPAFTALDGGQTAIAMARDTTGAFLFVITQPIGPSLANPPLIYVFATKPGSTTLTQVGSPFPLTYVPSALSAITYTTSSGATQTLLLVTGILDLTVKNNDNTISIYQVSSSGSLTVPTNNIYTTAVDPTAVLAVNTSPVGQPTIGGIFVYLGNQGSQAGGLSVFEVCTQPNQTSCPGQSVANSVLVPVGNTLSVGQDPIAMLVDPTNSFLYVLCNVGNNVYAYKITATTGVLSALSPASVQAGGFPVALAMNFNYNESALFMYVSNNQASTLTGFTVSATTGSVSNPLTTIFLNGSPSAMAAGR